MLRKQPLRFLSLVFFAALALADAAPAQWGPIKTRDVDPPPFPGGSGVSNEGGPGNTQLMGSEGGDGLSDLHPNDADVFHDSPGGSDGVLDVIIAKDGDGNDTAYVGPEDIVNADPGDTIIILAPGGGEPLWSGSFTQYLRMKALVRWIRDQLQALFELSPNKNEPDFWQNAVTYVSIQLGNNAPNFVGGESIAFSSAFALGPYEVGEVPESPLDCLNWMPYWEAGPLEATASIDFNAAQYAEAEAGAQAILGYLLAEIVDQ